MKPAPIDPPEIQDTLWQGIKGVVGWDVGANCGQTIPHMLERFDHVVAFEPAQECWPYLDELIGTVNGGLTILPIGLSDKNAKVDLIALPDKIDTGQLVTAGTHGMEWNPDSSSGLIRTVPCRTADSLIRSKLVPPDFMKIDVEGHELKVLTGATQTLDQHRPELFIEFHSKTLYELIHEFLHPYGYTITTIRHPHYPAGSDMWLTHGWLKAKA